MIVDAHVHVFRSADELPRVVDALVPAEREATVEDLLAVMGAAGVQRAVLVPLATEDGYVAEALRTQPDRFAAVAVADAAMQGRDPGTRALEAMTARRDALPFHALRTQWLGDPAQPLIDSPMLPVLRELARAGRPLWTYVPPEQLPLLAQVPAAVPDLPVVLNHLGFCPHDMQVDRHGRPWFADPFPGDALEVVCGMARHPSVFLMFSGLYAMSRQDPPYTDLEPTVRRLADAFGADRMLWASDYPWTRDVPGLDALLDAPAELLGDPSAGELAAIRGGTALKLFPHLRNDWN